MALVSLFWYLAGVTIQNSNDRFSGVSITRLLIDNVKDSDVGRYECVATLGRMGRLFNIDDTAANFFYRLNIGQLLLLSSLFSL